MEMGKDHCVYFPDSKLEPAKVLLQRCHVVDGWERSCCVVDRVAARVYQNITLRALK
jgi:hypothetical protein